jgi:predicted nucleic acid-binding protein
MPEGGSEVRALVMDGSTALGFLMADEQAPQARRALEALERGVPTFVPSHWALETANGLLMAERRKRITQADAAEALEILGQLPIETDDETGRRAAGETAGLARQYGLTIYDAAYLELALRRGAALATSDAALAKAARKAGVDVI